jgi:hypothetical protein
MAYLGWLVPDHLPPDTQTLPLPPHSRRSILSPEKEMTTHAISIHAYMNHIQGNITQLKH